MRKCGMPSQMNYMEDVLEKPEDIANSFARYFKSVFSTNDDDSAGQDNIPNSYCYNFRVKSELLISVDDTVKILKKSKNTTTSGTDLIPSFLVKDCAYILAEPLTAIYNKALETCVFPNKWKEALVVPVYKSGEKQAIMNYRPISILNNFAKSFESMLSSYIYNTIAANITTKQHGFVKGRSTSTNLFLLTDFISKNIDQKVQTDVIYTDFAKAFDRVNHSLLLLKMSSMGFSAQLIELMRSYLGKRACRVASHGSYSSVFCPTSGVPQGSNLGPLLFVIFINDLSTILTVDHLLYADDLKMYTSITSLDDCLNLQKNLELLQSWCSKNSIQINVSKCAAISFGLSHNPIEYEYNLSNSVIARQNEVKDLGVLFNSKLDFSNHLSNCLSKCYKLCGFVIRNTQEFSIKTVLHLFRAIVLSSLEYCIIVWNPHAKVHINALESIQRKILQFCHYRQYRSYPRYDITNRELNSLFQVDTLFARRERLQVQFLSRIFDDRYDSPEILALFNIRVPSGITRQNRITFYLPVPRTNIRKYSPLYQICEAYHHVEDEVPLFK